MKKKALAFCIMGFSFVNANLFIHKDKKVVIGESDLRLPSQRMDSPEHASYFIPQFIKDKSFQSAALAQEKAEKVEFATQDGIKLQGLFFDRASDHILIIGQGCHSEKEKLLPFLKLFSDYDIFIFDYRWLAWEQSWFSFHKIIFDSLSKYFVDSQQDIKAAIEYLKKRKAYRSVNGIGLCYSGMMFCAAQASSLQSKQPLFDKLVIDSALYSMQQLTETVLANPKLCCNNKEGGYRCKLSAPILWCITGLGKLVFGTGYSDLKIVKDMQNLGDTQLLLIHGQNDKLVPIEYFWSMLETANKSSSCAIVFPHAHTVNHLKGKDAYAYFIRQFLAAKSTIDFAGQFIDTEKH